ncbi:MAG TPA: DNA recombination protein RmuC [Pyrinomonadaceae bacterium]|nr:DNA recombination protein RmuC [Pyrinomonadaceae bacterium]
MNGQVLAVFAMFLLGGALGAALGWLLLRTKARASNAAELATLKERLTGKETELQKLQASFDAAVADHNRTREDNSQLNAELAAERRAAQAREESFRQAADELSGRFAELSQKALNANNQSFLELAKSTLEKYQENAKGDLESRQKAIDQLVEPLKKSLDKVDVKIGEIEKERVGAYAGLRLQVESLATDQLKLQKETSNLVNALRTPIVRGRWGEIQLKRVVEIAGMIEYCDFNQQETVSTDTGKLRPDMTIRLPNDRTIVVDSKVPLQAYLEALEARDEETRVAKLKDHARQIRTHLSKLGAKAYWEQFEQSPEFVFLFLPGETFFSAALEQDPSLIEFGVDQRVILATPTTLIALLKAVSYGWKQEQMAASAQEVSKLGKDLYDRLRVFTKHFESIGAGLKRALESYNDGVGSLEGRVLRTARKFKELGAITGEEIEVVEPVDKTARALSLDEGGLFPELVAGESEPNEDESTPLQSSKSATGQA